MLLLKQVAMNEANATLAKPSLLPTDSMASASKRAAAR